MLLNTDDRLKVVDIISHLHQFTDEGDRGRRIILEDASLGQYVDDFELSGSAGTVASDIVSRLEKDKKLGPLLSYVLKLKELPRENADFLTDLIERYRPEADPPDDRSEPVISPSLQPNGSHMPTEDNRFFVWRQWLKYQFQRVMFAAFIVIAVVAVINLIGKLTGDSPTSRTQPSSNGDSNDAFKTDTFEDHYRPEWKILENGAYTDNGKLKGAEGSTLALDVGQSNYNIHLRGVSGLFAVLFRINLNSANSIVSAYRFRCDRDECHLSSLSGKERHTIARREIKDEFSLDVPHEVQIIAEGDAITITIDTIVFMNVNHDKYLDGTTVAIETAFNTSIDAFEINILP